MLVALECEFRAVQRDAVDDVLDDLARHLFGQAGATPHERVVAMAAAAWAALPDEGRAPEDWLLESALSAGRASGAVRVAVAADVGRRAGIRACAARVRGCWVVHVAEGGKSVAADVGRCQGEGAPLVDGRVCAHGLACAVLTGLGDAALIAGDAATAEQACGLRGLLPPGGGT
jgi:hypothetical protein